jgi:hypothetical protein
MAKKQSFEAKTLKKASVQEFKSVKVVFSYQAAGNNGWRYKEQLIKVPFEANEEQFIQQEIDKIRQKLAG